MRERRHWHIGHSVALLAEGVDRNSLPQLTAYSALHPGIANLSPIGLIVRGAKQK